MKIATNEFRQVERLRGMKCFPGDETQFVGNTMTIVGHAGKCEATHCLQCFNAVGWATGRASGL